MNTSKWMKRFAVIAGSAVMGLTLATVTNAEVEPVTAEVEWIAPITISAPVPNLQFGLLDVNMANGHTVAISAENPTTVTDANGNVVGGTQSAAEMTVTATASQTLSIQVGNITNNTGYTLGSFMCKYDTGSPTACQAAPHTPTSVASATLLVGATLTGDGAAVAGVRNGSFDVTVLYQ
jgi:hypothetical protein